MRSPLFPAGRQNISFYRNFQLQLCKQHDVTKTTVENTSFNNVNVRRKSRGNRFGFELARGSS